MRLPVLLILLSHIALTGWVITPVMAHAAWAEARPRLAANILNANALGHLSGVVILGALLAHDAVERPMIWLLHADKVLLHQVYAGEQSINPAWNLALILILLLAAALTLTTIRQAHRNRMVRREHHLMRSLEPRPEPEVTVLNNDAPAIWCIAGRYSQRRIFVTTAALSLLSADELQAAIEHERAHLSRHHHRAVFAADTIASVVGKYGALRRYATAVRHLVEIDADDIALRRTHRHVLASALLRLGESTARPHRVTMALNRTSTGRRIRRLIDDPSPRSSLFAGAGAAAAAVTALLLPFAVVFLPALVLAGSGH